MNTRGSKTREVLAISRKDLEQATNLRNNPGARKALKHFSPPDIPCVGEGQMFFPHQAMALEQVARDDRGQDLFGVDGFAYDMDMGAGKLRILLYDAMLMIKQGKARRALLVMPNSTIKQQKEEILEFTRDNSVNVVVVNTQTMGSHVSGEKTDRGNFVRGPRWDEDSLMQLMGTAPPNTIFITSYTYLSVAAKAGKRGLQLNEEGAPAKWIAQYAGESSLGDLGTVKRKFPGFPFDSFDEAWPLMASHPEFCQWLEGELGAEEGTFWTGLADNERLVEFDRLLGAVTLSDNPWKIAKRRPFDFMAAGIDMVCLDESHRIKNNSARTATIGLFDNPQVKVRRLASGTMMPKEPKDLLRQLDWCFPLRDSSGTTIGNRIFGSEQSFLDKFCNPGEDNSRGNQAGKWDYKTTDVPVTFQDDDGEIRTEWMPPLKAIRKSLSAKVQAFDENGTVLLDPVTGKPQLIGPVGVNVRREAWGYTLPAKKEKIHFVKLSPLQRSLYNYLYMQQRDAILNDPAMRKAWDKFNSGDDEGELPKSILFKFQVLEQFISAPDSAGLANAIAELLSDATYAASMPADVRRFAKMLLAMQDGGAADAGLEKSMISSKVTLVDKLITAHFHKDNKTEMPRLDADGEEILGPDGKVEMMRKTGKVIVFCNHIPVAEHFQKHSVFGKAGKNISRVYHAGEPAALKAFISNPNVKIIWAVKDSITEGHNLTMANMCVVVSMPWVHGTLDQMLARTYRPKQRFEVSVHHILCQRTVEPIKFARLVARRSEVMQINSDYGDEIDAATGQKVTIPDLVLPPLNEDMIDELSEPSDLKPYTDAYQTMLRYEEMRARQMEPVFGRELYDMSDGSSVPGFPIVVPAIKTKAGDKADEWRGDPEDAWDVTGQVHDFDFDNFEDDEGRSYGRDGTPVGSNFEVTDPIDAMIKARGINMLVAGERVNVNVGTLEDPQWQAGEIVGVDKDEGGDPALTVYYQTTNWRGDLEGNQRVLPANHESLQFPRAMALPIGARIALRKEGSPFYRAGWKDWMEEIREDFIILEVKYDNVYDAGMVNKSKDYQSVYMVQAMIPVETEVHGDQTIVMPREGADGLTVTEEFELVQFANLPREAIRLLPPGKDEEHPDRWLFTEMIHPSSVRESDEWVSDDKALDNKALNATSARRKAMISRLWTDRDIFSDGEFRSFIQMLQQEIIIVDHFMIPKGGVGSRIKKHKTKAGRPFDYNDAQSPAVRSVGVSKPTVPGRTKKQKLNIPKAFPKSNAYIMAYITGAGEIEHCVLQSGKFRKSDDTVVSGMEIWLIKPGIQMAKHRGFIIGLNLRSARDNAAENLRPWAGFKRASSSNNDALDFAIAG